MLSAEWKHPCQRAKVAPGRGVKKPVQQPPRQTSLEEFVEVHDDREHSGNLEPDKRGDSLEPDKTGGSEEPDEAGGSQEPHKTGGSQKPHMMVCSQEPGTEVRSDDEDERREMWEKMKYS